MRAVGVVVALSTPDLPRGLVVCENSDLLSTSFMNRRLKQPVQFWLKLWPVLGSSAARMIKTAFEAEKAIWGPIPSAIKDVALLAAMDLCESLSAMSGAIGEGDNLSCGIPRPFGRRRSIGQAGICRQRSGARSLRTATVSLEPALPRWDPTF